MKIEVLKKPGSKWFWRLISKNGRTLAHSETYSSKTKANKTAERVANALSIGLLELA